MEKNLKEYVWIYKYVSLSIYISELRCCTPEANTTL